MTRAGSFDGGRDDVVFHIRKQVRQNARRFIAGKLKVHQPSEQPTKSPLALAIRAIPGTSRIRIRFGSQSPVHIRTTPVQKHVASCPGRVSPTALRTID
ncbi:hypothetical protein VDGE_30713 [Verticillium dahliae]|uniref:Uncharacterized protein n=1 Tax=Verticillium dahliae TaxID=27337 RepID=A0A444RKV6_VERDA|nr:hypothetical protein VDGE_30713 [Verticillium dahliae]